MSKAPALGQRGVSSLGQPSLFFLLGLAQGCEAIALVMPLNYGPTHGVRAGPGAPFNQSRQD